MSDSTYKRFMYSLLEADETATDPPPEEPTEEPTDDFGGGGGGGDSFASDPSDGGDEETGDTAKDPSGLGDPESQNYQANKAQLGVFTKYLEKIERDYNISLNAEVKGAIEKVCLQIWNTAYSKAAADLTNTNVSGYTGYKSNI